MTRVEGVILASGGSRVLGTYYAPDGEARRPAVVLLHGLPGTEKNLDLAHHLRRSGIGCLAISFRGAWGSEGDFHMDHLIPDTQAALDWLEPRANVEPSRLGLVGYSLGGWAALEATALDRRVHAVAALAPLLDGSSVDIPPGLAEESARVLRGAGAESITAQWHALPAIARHAAALSGRPVLLATADRDAAFPPAHYAALVDLIPGVDWVRFPEADHTFISVRPGLCHTVAQWLLRALDSTREVQVDPERPRSDRLV
ncbi:MAG: alpha/beta hydrolase family protein [Anaerolineales bacterium]